MQWLGDRKTPKPGVTRNMCCPDKWRMLLPLSAGIKGKRMWLSTHALLAFLPRKKRALIVIFSLRLTWMTGSRNFKDKSTLGPEKGTVGKRGTIFKSLLSFQWRHKGRQDQRDDFIKLIIISVGDHLNTWLPQCSQRRLWFGCVSRNYRISDKVGKLQMDLIL